jgi:hypothetical protein
MRRRYRRTRRGHNALAIVPLGVITSQWPRTGMTADAERPVSFQPSTVGRRTARFTALKLWAATFCTFMMLVSQARGRRLQRHGDGRWQFALRRKAASAISAAT